MTTGALRHLSYDVRGRDEPMLRCGAENGPQVLLLPPLFGEMNRTRRLLADVMRGLAAENVGSWFPDLPGTGESLTLLEDVDWDWWRDAAAAAARAAASRGRLITASIRGGALLDDVEGGCGWWRLAPVAGQTLLRDLLRIRQLADAEEGDRPELADLRARLDHTPLELAGYRLCPALARDLAAAEPRECAPLRTVELGDTADPAAGMLAGPRLWRRAEPGASPTLAHAITADLASWTRTCAAA